MTKTTRRALLSGAAAIGGTALLPRRARAATVLRWAENQAPSHPAARSAIT